MHLSASQLGQQYGLTGEEMNRLFVKRGIYSGNPGDYDLTPLGRQFALTQSHHRGNGGYSQYNRYWITRKFDESIKEILDISDDVINEVKKEVADLRAERYATQAAARAKANADFIAKEAAKKAAELAEKQELQELGQKIAKLKKAGKITLLVSGVAVTGYGIYKAVTHVKKWYNERKNTEVEETDGEENV